LTKLFFILLINFFFFNGDWGLGIGDWGLGIWGLGQYPKTQTPKPNPPQTQKKLNKIKKK